MDNERELFSEESSSLSLHPELFWKIRFEGRDGGEAKRKLYENWKFGFDPFFMGFDPVFEGFDLKKRGFEGCLNLGKCATGCN